MAKLAGNDLLQDVLRLMTGTVSGRLIILATMPFVTRLYSPHDFALLAVYLATLSVIGAITCLRYEVAIPVAQDDVDAAHLLVLSLAIAVAMAAMSLIVVSFAPERVAGLIRQPALAPWLWLIPFGMLLSGSYAALQFWATRARRFGTIAKTRIYQAVVGVSTMLVMGCAGIAPLGLLLGNLLTASVGSLRLGLEAIRLDGPALRRVSWSGMNQVLFRYRRFPLYSAPDGLANIVGMQAPILIIAAYSGSEAGFLLLAQQVMAAPMALLGSSISQVYLSRAPDAMHEGRLGPFTLSIVWRLILIGVGPLALAGFLSPTVFPLIFGAEWARSGEIAAWLVPWIGLQFLASPISMVMHVARQQKTMLILTIFGAALRIGSVFIAAQYYPQYMVEAFVFFSSIFYLTCLLVFIETSRIAR